MSIFGTVWGRFTANWRQYGSIGLGMSIAAVAMYAVSFTIIVGLGGAQILRLALASGTGGGISPLDQSSIWGAFLGGIMLASLLGFFVMAFILGGMTASVVALRAGEPVGLGTFFRNGSRYIWRMAGLLFLGAVLTMLITFGIEIVFLIGGLVAGVVLAAAHSPIGFFVMIPFGLLLLPFMIGLQIYLIFYSGYLLINDRLDVFGALGKAISALFKGLGEAYLSALVYLGIGLGMAVPTLIVTAILMLVSRPLGILVYLLFFLFMGIFAGPFLMDYLAERFEQRVRPKIAS